VQIKPLNHAVAAQQAATACELIKSYAICRMVSFVMLLSDH